MVINDETGSSIPHEVRHTFLDTKLKNQKTNYKLYDNIKSPRSFPYVKKDYYSTEHGLVHLGELHREYVKQHP